MTVPSYVDGAHSSMTIAVLEGFIQLLLEPEINDPIEAVGLPPLSFAGDASYGPDVTGIYVMTSGKAPGLSLVISVYIADPNIGANLVQFGVQVRARSADSDYRPAMFILDTIRDDLNGKSQVMLSGHPTSVIYSASLGDMGLDSNDRYEITENYYLIVSEREQGE